MVDYYSILAKAMNAPEAADAQWRHDMYERARQMLVTRLRERQPPASRGAVANEQSALDAAIRRIEAEMTASADDSAFDNRSDDIADETTMAPESGPIASPLRLSRGSWIAIACVVAAIGAGGLIAMMGHGQHAAAPPATSAATSAAQSPTTGAPAPKVPAVKVAARKDGDLPPGTDGGSAYNDLPYVFRRQPTFYRTLQPVGTIIVDKLQHFLYLIQPNNVALRYGIGLGEQCVDLAGLRHVASKAEWPQWLPTPDMIARGFAKPGTVEGGPGNPLGARVMELDDGKSRINGTNAPATIGTSVMFGCIRLGNDDVTDLYGRVPNGTAVVVN